MNYSNPAMELPKISIIIPSYNYGRYLETAIKSVLAQKYPNLELIILDGGSNDNTLDVIKKYSEHIAFWRSEKDLCSNDTVNQGFTMASGDVLGLLCADDWYEAGIFHDVGENFSKDKDLDILSFHVRYKCSENKQEDKIISDNMELNTFGEAAPNGRFYRKQVFENYGQMRIVDRNSEFLLCADWELMLRFSILPLKHKLIPKIGYTYLMQPESFSYGSSQHKTLQKILEEHVDTSSRYVAKSELYSRKLLKHFRKIHTKATSRLHLINSALGNEEKANEYKKLGKALNPIFWSYKMRKIQKKKDFQKIIEKIKSEGAAQRVQTLK